MSLIANATPAPTTTKIKTSTDRAMLWLVIVALVWLLPLVAVIVMLFVNGTIRLH